MQQVDWQLRPDLAKAGQASGVGATTRQSDSLASGDGLPRAVARFCPGTGNRIRLETVAVVAIAVVAIALVPNVRDLDRHALVMLGKLGALAPLLLIATYSLASVMLLPVFVLDFAAGAHFGFWRGVLWIQLAASVASVAGYWHGRLLLRGLVDRFLERSPRLRSIGQMVQSDAGWTVFLTRLSPVFSFSVLNAFYGALGVPFGRYLIATMAGTLSGTAMYVYAGMMAGDLSGAPGHPGRTSGQWIVETIGFAGTIALVVFVTRRAQSSLNRRASPG